MSSLLFKYTCCEYCCLYYFHSDFLRFSIFIILDVSFISMYIYIYMFYIYVYVNLIYNDLYVYVLYLLEFISDSLEIQVMTELCQSF